MGNEEVVASPSRVEAAATMVVTSCARVAACASEPADASSCDEADDTVAMT